MADASITTLIQWTSEYAVGVRQIDEEHRRLFSLAEGMHQAMLQGNGKAVLEELLTGLVDYTRHHFIHEEQLMERVHYPRYREHREKHEAFRVKVKAMQDRSASGEITMTIEVMQFLISWIRRHIMSSDRQIAKHVRCSNRFK